MRCSHSMVKLIILRCLNHSKKVYWRIDMNSVIAIVTFSVPSEAKRAFNHLSYRKYQHIPLYLEYLPIDLWSEGMIDGMV